jgi:hypothetical protein
MKSGQLDLYLIHFRRDHPDLFRKKLHISLPIFDRLVELVEDHEVFHNNSHVSQHPVPTQLTIFLIRLGHYDNTSAPKYIAQWAGVCQDSYQRDIALSHCVFGPSRRSGHNAT